MKIDNKKFIELLVEATGQDEEKVTKQLGELITEINDSLAQGDAYEIEGFGIFTKFGANLSFLPSSELETEINYKYAGMKPLELEDEVSLPEEEAPKEPVSSGGSNPFAGLIDDEDIEEMDKMDASQSEESDESDELEEVEDEVDDFITEITSEDSEEEEAPGPDKWGIDTYKDDNAENVFGALLGDDDAETIETNEIEETEEDITSDELESEDHDTEEESVSDEIEDLDENPFEEISFDDLEAGNVEDSEETASEEDTSSEEKSNDDAPIIPVITNVSSDLPDPDEDPFEMVDDLEEDLGDEKDKKKKKGDAQKASPLLLAIVIIVSFGGIGYVAISFGFLNIDSIPFFGNKQEEQQVVMLPARPQNNANEAVAVDNGDSGAPGQPVAVDNSDDGRPGVTNPAEQQETTPPPPPPAQEQVVQEEQLSEQPEEQTTQTVVQEQTQVSDEPTYSEPINENDLGIYGQAQTEMSGVYTVVLYSLTKESNALAKIAELEQAGLKARLTTYPSSTYGTIWRVNIGHFRTLADASIAIYDLGAPYSDDFFITKL